MFSFAPGIGLGTPAAVAPTLQLFGRAVILQQVAQLVFVAAFPYPGDVLADTRLARDKVVEIHADFSVTRLLKVSTAIMHFL